MKQYISKDALVAEIKRLIRANELYLSEHTTDEVRFQKTGAYSVLNDLLHFLDTLEVKEVQEEPVSDDLDEAANDYAHDILHDDVFETFRAGAQWQKKHLWKSADGDDLPEIDREVIVLYQRYPMENNEYAVGFGHRPKEYWDGRNIETDEVTRYYPKRYDKGGWNVPDVKFWLDCYLPKMEE